MKTEIVSNAVEFGRRRIAVRVGDAWHYVVVFTIRDGEKPFLFAQHWERGAASDNMNPRAAVAAARRALGQLGVSSTGAGAR